MIGPLTGRALDVFAGGIERIARFRFDRFPLSRHVGGAVPAMMTTATDPSDSSDPSDPSTGNRGSDLSTSLAAGVRAGFGAAVVMDVPMVVQREGRGGVHSGIHRRQCAQGSRSRGGLPNRRDRRPSRRGYTRRGTLRAHLRRDRGHLDRRATEKRPLDAGLSARRRVRRRVRLRLLRTPRAPAFRRRRARSCRGRPPGLARLHAGLRSRARRVRFPVACERGLIEPLGVRSFVVGFSCASSRPRGGTRTTRPGRTLRPPARARSGRSPLRADRGRSRSSVGENPPRRRRTRRPAHRRRRNR